MVFILLVAIGLVLLRPRPDAVEMVEVNEPEAPLWEQTTYNSVTELTDQDLRMAIDSPDHTTQLQLVGTDQQSASGLLQLTNHTDDSTITISQNATAAGWWQPEQVYFQTFSDQTDNGLYIYDLPTGQQQQIVATSNLKSFGDVIPIDANSYFYLSTATGELGFGFTDGSPNIVLDTQVLDIQSNYMRRGAFDHPSISPDGNYAVVYDLRASESYAVTVRVYPTTATSSADLYLQQQVYLPISGFNSSDQTASWSDDSQLLVVGTGTVIDITDKRIIAAGEQDNHTALLSPDGLHLLLIDTNSGLATISAVNTISEPKQIAEHINQILWLTNQQLILTIGQRLYLYDLDLGLYALSTDKAQYVIQYIDPATGSALISTTNSLYQLIITP